MQDQLLSTKRAIISFPTTKSRKFDRANLARYIKMLDKRNKTELKELDKKIAKFKANVNEIRQDSGLPALG